ncbi:MAG: DDE-type integrase/transposase/recombinase [Methylobacter sp.]
MIATLTRSNLHRCLQHHNLSRLSERLPAEDKATTKTFKTYEPGFLHIDTAQINLGQDKWDLFVAIDRATRYVYLELHDNKRMETARDFLEHTRAHYPFKIEKILTDNGIEFSNNPLPDSKKPKDKEHPFAALCKARQIEHRTTLVKYPWINGMVEAMNKKVKADPTKRFHYNSVDELKAHWFYYLLNYNFNLKLRAIGRKTPFETIL